MRWRRFVATKATRPAQPARCTPAAEPGQAQRTVAWGRGADAVGALYVTRIGKLPVPARPRLDFDNARARNDDAWGDQRFGENLDARRDAPDQPQEQAHMPGMQIVGAALVRPVAHSPPLVPLANKKIQAGGEHHEHQCSPANAHTQPRQEHHAARPQYYVVAYHVKPVGRDHQHNRRKCRLDGSQRASPPSRAQQSPPLETMAGLGGDCGMLRTGARR